MFLLGMVSVQKSLQSRRSQMDMEIHPDCLVVKIQRLHLYSTSQGHTWCTAIPQPVLTCFHKSLLDRDVDLLIRWDNKILSHMEVEASFLINRYKAEYLYVPSCQMLCHPLICQPISFTLILTIESSRARLTAALAFS